MSKSRHIKYYWDSVLKSLILDYDLPKDQAEKLITNSTFSELLKKDLNFVGHYPPDYWAEHIIDEAHFIHT